MRDRAHTLSDFRVPPSRSSASLAAGASHHNVARLMAQYGDAKLSELLAVLADCPKAKTGGFRDRCRVLYGKDSRSSTPGDLERMIWRRPGDEGAEFSVSELKKATHRKRASCNKREN